MGVEREATPPEADFWGVAVWLARVVVLCVAVSRCAAVGATTVATEDVGVRPGSTVRVGVGLEGRGGAGVATAFGLAVAVGPGAASVPGCGVLVGVGVGVDRASVAVGVGPSVPVAVGVGVSVGVGVEDGTGVCVGGSVGTDDGGPLALAEVTKSGYTSSCKFVFRLCSS